MLYILSRQAKIFLIILVIIPPGLIQTYAVPGTACRSKCPIDSDEILRAYSLQIQQYIFTLESSTGCMSVLKMSTLGYVSEDDIRISPN